MKFTEEDYEAITRAVEQLEEQTAAELVVVIRPFSGDYRDVAYLFGVVVVWLVLIFILVSSWEIEPYTIPLEIIPFFVVPALLCSVTPVRRWLTSARRRRQQVQASARDAFFAEGVGRTRARTGLLVYLSDLERRAEVLADEGVLESVPAAEMDAFIRDLKRIWGEREPVAALTQEINRFGERLARYLPATTDNPNEIPDRPRVKREWRKRPERRSMKVKAG